MYGNPEDILSAKQTQQARDQQRKRRTLHVKAGWSDARKKAEALFAPHIGSRFDTFLAEEGRLEETTIIAAKRITDHAPEAARPSTPATPSNSAHAGNRKDSL